MSAHDVLLAMLPEHLLLAFAEEDEEDRTGADLNEIYLDSRSVVADLRTSLIVDPPTGAIRPGNSRTRARD